MVALDGGAFLMGSDRHYAEEAPVRETEVGPFLIDTHAVTNRDFAAFIEATCYVTVAEQPLSAVDYPGIDPDALKPGAMVFHPPRGPQPAAHWSHWWRYVRGANWRKPEGRQSVFAGRLDHPVVCIAWLDASAYARWAGKDLPTETEWEYAARGGLAGAEFTWGEELHPASRLMANVWQGQFPWRNLAPLGQQGTMPVGSFPPNGYGLYDMAGNVWEWTDSWWSAARSGPAGCCAGLKDPVQAPPESYDPDQPDIRIPSKVVKGGSHLCDPNHCFRFRPAARQPQMIDTATNHIGFRCVIREPVT
jgi:sulfatase modifying factor 1